MPSLVCPSCATVATNADAAWCEACGSDFAGEHQSLAGPACVDCGADHGEIVEGYCGQCGRKQPAARDHLVESAEGISAVSDRGQRHHQNEDAFSIASIPGARIAVVCDGVSTTDNPQDASLLAATAARDSLAATFADTGVIDTVAMTAAIEQAQAAAASVPQVPNGQGAASSTIVAAVLTNDALILGSIGDSRAYWMADDSAVQLTTDDSWAREQVEAGAVTAEEAALDPRAHSITRWIGADADTIEPHIIERELSNAGLLLLCTDGLWNYLDTTDAVYAKLREHQGADLSTTASALVAFANERGGHDNITVVLAAQPDTSHYDELSAHETDSNRGSLDD